MALQDLFGSPSTLAAPFDYLQELRDQAPVFFSEKLNAFVITRWADVQYILSKPKLFSSFPLGASASTSAAFATEYAAIYLDMGTLPPLPTLVITDGDVHRRYRDVANRNFSPADMRALEGSIRLIVDELIDAFIEAGSADIYADLCLKLPSFTMCDVLGLPREGAPILKRGADTSPRLQSGALETEETRRDLHRQRAEMHVFIQQYIRRYRENPADNLISQIIQAPTNDGIPLNEQELISIIGTLNVGGNETTVNGLGNMFYVALTTHGMIDKLSSNPAEIPAFIEESLRLESAVSAMPRRVVQDTELHGIRLPAESRLFVVFAAANRDDTRFACPHQVDLERSPITGHMGFGMGPHFCLGAPLARLQMRVAMEIVLTRLRNLRLDPEALPVQHQSKLVVRGVAALPVTFASTVH